MTEVEPLEPATTSPAGDEAAGFRGPIEVTEQRVLWQRVVSPFAFAAVKQKEVGGMLKVRAQVRADAVVLHLEGHIVRGPDTAILHRAVFSQREARVIALDLSQVDVVDAGGLSALLELREWARANGIEFKLINPVKPVHRIFSIARLDSVFEITSEAEVLSAATLSRRASMLELVPGA